MELVKVLDKREIFGREFQIYGTTDEPLFLAKDVAEMIDYAYKDKSTGRRNVNMMLQTIDEDEKIKRATILPSGDKSQEMWMLTEDGLYEVLMQSRKPIAKEFKKVVKQILKEIRKNGGYIATYENDTDEIIMARALLIAQKAIERKDEIIKQQQQIIDSQTPVIEFMDKVFGTESTVDVGEAAKILKLPFGRNTLFSHLRDTGILSSKNVPYQKYIDRGLFEVDEVYIPHLDKCKVKTKVTQKGLNFLDKKFKSN